MQTDISFWMLVLFVCAGDNLKKDIVASKIYFSIAHRIFWVYVFIF